MTKKTIFLWGMFLMFFGIANINAQVRIGSEILPNPVAVLDLNHSNNEDVGAKGGLLLPRVRLKSYTDITVFREAPARGLMVYNVNKMEYDRPGKGVYYYDGTKWVPVSENNELDFTVTSDTKRVWLGRKGELRKTLKAEVTPNMPPDDWQDSTSYVWIVSTAGDNPVTIKTIATVRPELTLDIDVLREDDGLSQADVNLLSSGGLHAAYNIALTVKYRWIEKTQDIAILAIGSGAWVGEKRWLKVANTNLGAEEIPLENQLTLDYNEESWETVGHLYQWGSAFYRSVRTKVSSKTMDPLTELTTVPTNGQPLRDDVNMDVFVKAHATTGDWRTWYPSGYSSANVPSAWRWSVNAGEGETPDPCRKTLGGEWRVPTAADWDNIAMYNTVEMFTSSHRGITVSPEPGKIAWFLPETQLFSDMGDNIFPYPDPDGMLLGYWFDDADNVKGVALYKEGDMESLPTVVSKERAYGLNIRCVAN